MRIIITGGSGPIGRALVDMSGARRSRSDRPQPQSQFGHKSAPRRAGRKVGWPIGAGLGPVWPMGLT